MNNKDNFQKFTRLFLYFVYITSICSLICTLVLINEYPSYTFIRNIVGYVLSFIPFVFNLIFLFITRSNLRKNRFDIPKFTLIIPFLANPIFILVGFLMASIYSGLIIILIYVLQGVYFLAWIGIFVTDILLWKVKKEVDTGEKSKNPQIEINRANSTESLNNNQKKIFSDEITSASQVIKPVDEPSPGLKIFLSYATLDAGLFKIPQLSASLEVKSKIGEVLYWQEDMSDNIIEYMNNNLGVTDVVLLFCSPNSLSSNPVTKEWTAADAMNKPIIPIFLKTDHIPPLLRSRLGIEYDAFDLEKVVNEIHQLILKKVKV